GTPYSGKWIAQSSQALFDPTADFKGKPDTYQAQISCTLSFDAQGGYPTPGSQVLLSGSVSPTVTNPTRPDYTFDGWYTEKYGAGTRWELGTTKMPTSNVTLYAKWNPINAVTLSFDAQGGTNTPATQDLLVGSKARRVDDPVRTGHTFMGWFTQPDDTGIPWVFAEDVVSVNTTLYAQWTINTYTLSFNSNGGTAIEPQRLVFDTLATAPVNNPVRDGYTFVDWYTEPSFTNAWNFATNKMPGADTTLFAKWDANTYSVRFNINEGTDGIMTDQLFTYDAPVKTLSKNTFTKTNHYFAGWAKTPTGPVEFVDQQPVRNIALLGTLDLYAVWKENTYSIEFNPNIPAGSTLSGNTPAMQDVRYSQTINLKQNSFACTGYTFSYWSENPDGSGTRYEDQQAVSKLRGENQTGETITLYAHWTYTVAYDKTFDDATGTITSSVFTADTWEKLPAAGFSRPGSTLGGWNSDKAKAQAGIAEYTLGHSVKNLPGNKAGAITLYAVWTEQIVVTSPLNPTISIDAQGTPSPDASTYFESSTNKNVVVTSMTCAPVTTTPGTASVFTNPNQWQDIVFTLTPENATATNIFLKDGDEKKLNWTIPAKTDSATGKLKVTFALKRDPTLEIAYNTEAVPVAQMSFAFALAEVK
ncbi:MAG: InlB B-repeat-containing protein, partial [Raoultibacter sp.]